MRTRFQAWIFLLCIFTLSPTNAQDNGFSDCESKIKTNSYLGIAQEMITNAKDSTCNCPNQSSVVVSDCEEMLKGGNNKSKVYTIWPKSRALDSKSVDVFCDMETDGGGWTVIQRRGNFLRANDYFFQDWEAYKKGFGDIEKEFWLGNENIFALTNQKLYSIRFELKDVEGNKSYALYDTFWIDDEDRKYTLHVNGYSGDAGDSISSHDKIKFSTKDQDNDSYATSCAEQFKGGWWYGACHAANLNGLNLRGKHESYADGINWSAWKGLHESLDAVEIKIRPKNFRKEIQDFDLITPQ